MKIETIVLNEARNVTLTVYLQECSTETRVPKVRPGMLVLPGGGYQYCSDREADPVAQAYLNAGYHAFILRYSAKEHGVWPNPLEDYEQAITYIRDHAEAWGLLPDKIAVIGFSAGGHLAACAATMAKNKPNAAILGYAVCGSDVKGCNPTAPDAIAAVDHTTCPCFLMHTRNDNIVPIDNSLRFQLELAKHDVAFESHIYAYGPHGFSTCDTSIQSLDELCDRAPNWVSDSIRWLRDIFGPLTPTGMGDPTCPLRMSGNYEPNLSIACTVSHLLQHEAGKKVVLAALPNLPQDNPMYGKLRLQDLLHYAQMPADLVKQLDDTLQKIPNL